MYRLLTCPGHTDGRYRRHLLRRRLVACALVAAARLGLGTPAYAAEAVDFSVQIRPLLADRCFHCHGRDSTKRKAELRLDIEMEAKKEVIRPGDPEASELIARVTSADLEERMPPPDSQKKPLSPDEVNLLREWIAQGAPWEEHWAFVAPKAPKWPPVQQASWIRNEIDAFVLAEIEKAGLAPSPESRRETLIRRVSLDLTGLPPSPEAIDAFLEDPSPDAYEKVVDALLASPHYGERMAMDWLDGARYADTNGYQNDFARTMWPWRDWVIAAYNANMPFDQFTIEQIAGDLLPNATEAQRIATGFNRNNRAVTEAGSIEEEWRLENLVDRVETTAAVFLGLTMGCSRCHEHKYDPISQREFYEFMAFFNSTEDKGFYEETRGNTGPLITLPAPENAAKIAELDAAVASAQQVLDEAKQRAPEDFAAWKSRVAGTVPEATASVPRLILPFDGPKGFDGPFGPAALLDGSPESHIDLGQQVGFERDKPFTIAAWVRPTTPGTLFSKTSYTDQFRGVDTRISPDGRIEFHMANNWPQNALRVITDVRIKLGVWMHVCVTYDGSSKAEGVRIYIDGGLAALDIRADRLSETVATGEPFHLGWRWPDTFLRGAVGDFRYYDQALPPEEISALVSHALAKAAAGETPPQREAALREYLALYQSYEVLDKTEELRLRQKEKDEYVKNSVPSVMVLSELAEPRPMYVHKRGRYDSPDTTQPLQPGVPAFLPQLAEGAPRNRLGLAQWLVDPRNPLTARVNVNRLWGKFFGRGIVATSDDFGTQGDPPANPELLDWLAFHFASTGWDMKALQKRIVMSATYRQDSTVTPLLAGRDPENRLWARGPRFRLQAEIVRDNALALGGVLAAKIGGPSVRPYQPEKLWEELAGGAGEGPYVQSTGEDLHRRSLYTYRKRTVPHPTLATFDAPSWEICRVRRSRTNTPLQALALLNDITYVEAARGLALRILSEPGATPAERLHRAFRMATGRYPTAREARILETGFKDYLSSFQRDTTAAAQFVANGESPAIDRVEPAELAAYMAVASVILNLDETITKE